MLIFHFFEEKKELLQLKIDRYLTKIGSNPINDIVLPFQEIPSFFFQISQVHQRHFLSCLKDLSLIINGKETSKSFIENHDIIQVGKYRFIAEITATQSSGETQKVLDSHFKKTKIIIEDNNEEHLHQKLFFQVIAPTKEKPVLIKGDSFIVGADPASDLVLSDEYVSNKHFMIYRANNKFFIKDFGSTNGTFINKLKVKEIELPDPCEVKIGVTKISFFTEDSQNLIHSKEEKNKDNHFLSCIIGESMKMKDLKNSIHKIAKSDLTALILGESGTGKELIAKAIHSLSDRAQKPFLAINCGAISKDLIESELFGHLKGAFTGAISNRKGIFEEAENGTVFLDEIGELPLELQPKLLRVLENQEIKLVGSNSSIKVSTRIIAATNVNLMKAVENKTFREDLFHRLYIIPFTIPPLRERGKDIALIANDFLQNITKGKLSFSLEAEQKLLSHSWPGNVRELKNTIQRAALFAKDTVISAEEIQIFGFGLDEQIEEHSHFYQGGKTMDDFVKEIILGEIERCNGNRVQAARNLKIAKSTLHAKLKEYGVGPKYSNEIVSERNIR